LRRHPWWTQSGVVHLAVEATGAIRAPRVAKPALLSDNGSGYTSNLMAKSLPVRELRRAIEKSPAGS